MGRGGGGYWRLEMQLGLVLGYGTAQGRSVAAGGYPPPPFRRFPGGNVFQSLRGRQSPLRGDTHAKKIFQVRPVQPSLSAILGP